MRIVGGKYRHRIINYPSLNNTRPTKDMVREALFNALSTQVNDKTVLDLFAGSGALGIEALSRGAAQATFVDINQEAILAIKGNLNSLDIKNATVIKLDYQEAIQRFSNQKMVFDIIFLDPPYAANLYQEVINLIGEYRLLAKDGIIVCESATELDLVETHFQKTRRYKYGKSHLTILWR